MMHSVDPRRILRAVPLVVFVTFSSFLATTKLIAQSSSAPSQPELALPGSLLHSLLIVALCGALGAFAADLVTDGGRLERWSSDAQNWGLGFLAKLVVGAVAALILISLNPAEGSWLILVGTSLSAGVGGEALLLAVVAGRRADRAEQEAESARRDAGRTIEHAVTSLRRARARLTTSIQDTRTGMKTMREFDNEGVGADIEPLSTTEAARVLDDAIATLAGEAKLSITAQVHAILVEVLNRRDVDKRKLKDLGGDEPRRQMIAHEIARTWVGMLNPPFTDAHVLGDDTLTTLSARVRSHLV